jgi:hypothetical protein
MRVVTLDEVEEALRRADPSTLREMAHQLAHSHVALCGLTSREGDCSHIPESATRDRIDGLEVDRLASLLAPSAWTALWLGERL